MPGLSFAPPWRRVVQLRRASSRLGVQLVGSIVAVAVLAGATVGALSIAESRAALREDIFTSNIAAADLAAAHTAGFLEDIEASAATLAARTDLIAAVESQDFSRASTLLEAWRPFNPHVEDVSYWDSQGVMRAGGLLEASLIDKTCLPTCHWREVLFVTGQPMFGPPIPSRATGRPLIPFGVPLRAGDGAVLGHVSIGISLTALSTTLVRLNEDAGKRTALVDLERQLILAHPDPSFILTTESGRNEATNRLLRGERGVLESVDSAGEAVLAAFAPVPGVNWGVLVEEPAQQAFAVLDAMVAKIVIAVGGALSVAVLVGTLLAARIVKPLGRLRAAASAMADGDLTVRARLRRHDEIGELGGAFDSMADQLQGTVSQLGHQALHDALTGLPNRVLLGDRLEQAILTARREERGLALMVMDLDRFKEVNDTLGHHAGDLLLKEVGKRLCDRLDVTDCVARLGGDEFAVVLSATPDSAAATARKLLRALEMPFELEGHSVALAASIGIAMFPEFVDDVASMLRCADIAMYAAKRTRSGHAIYTPEHDQHSLDRLALLAELRQALTCEELILHFQPKLNLRTGEVAGAEALVRWAHPRRGLLGPDAFIGLAEQSGLMRPLTRWVVHETLRQVREWARAGVRVPVAINLSPSSLQDPDLVTEIAACLRAADVEPRWLEIEITEDAFMAHPDRVATTLAGLRALGIRVAIDDFGTGYSSLAYLQKLPVDTLKVDRGFVSTMRSDAGQSTIVRSIIDLGHNLGLEVVAEGVEDEATCQALAALGCDQAQGYLLGRPQPADEFARHIRTRFADSLDPRRWAA